MVEYLKRLRYRPYRVLLLLACVVIPIVHAFTVHPEDSEWTTVYVGTAQRLVHGADLYPAGTPFVYPPFCALLAVPFVYLPMWLSRFLLVWLSCLALGVMLVEGWRLSGGRQPLELGRGTPLRDHFVALLAAACALRLAFNVISHEQTDLILSALLMLGCSSLAFGKGRMVGVYWGLGAAFKATPLLFVGYLVWRRKWVSALVMVSVFTLVNLAPDLIYHKPQSVPWLGQWFDKNVQPFGDKDYNPGNWNATLADNQSIAGMAGRFFSTVVSIDSEGELAVKNVPNILGTQNAKFLVLGIYLGITLAVMVATWPGFKPLNRQLLARSEDGPSAYAWECSLVFIVILLISPMSSRAHFCTLILPALCLARVAVERGHWLAWSTLLGATGLFLLSWNVPMPGMHWWAKMSLWLGFVTWATILLFVGCLYFRRQQNRRGATELNL